jgi:lysophospholipase L1-like esterase
LAGGHHRAAPRRLEHPHRRQRHLRPRIALDEFEATYDRLLEQTKAALRHVQLVLCEPFALLPREADGAVHPWETNVRQRARLVEELAEKYGAPFVRFQKVFDEAIKHAPAEYWLPDGVHPTPAGHQLMADEWIRTASAV